MDTEYVIVVDENDKVIGKETKKATHVTKAIAGGLLHRAFSVMLFNSEGELLLQQRAGDKITFPYMFANTCCSHPLYVEDELIEENAMGVKNAAIRKLENELGITELNVDDLVFTTKIHYEAAQDAEWAEHEIDWLLLAKKEVEIVPNPSEVNSVRYVSKDALKQMFKDMEEGKVFIAPWFQLICETFLFKWWDRVEEIIANKGLPADLKEGLPEVTYLGTPGNAVPAKKFFPSG